MPVLYLFADLLYLIGYYLIGYRRKAIQANLSRCFPEKKAGEIKLIERRFFRNLADMILEVVKIHNMPEDMVHKMIYMDSSNEFARKQALEKKQNIMFLIGHYGNWELLGQILNIYYPHQLKVFYQKLKNPVSERFIYEIRSKHGTIPIPKQQMMRHILQTKDEYPVSYGVLADQRPRGNVETYNFFGQQIDFFTSQAAIAIKHNLAVYYIETLREKRGRYKVSVHKITDNPSEMSAHEIVQHYVSHIENSIRKQPESWLWSHKRFKNQK